MRLFVVRVVKLVEYDAFAFCLHLLGKVTFHLAENKRSPETPFAFMATFTHRLSAQEKPVHLPLGRALQEYSGAKNQAALRALLEPVRVEAYGSEMPLSQVGTVGSPEPRMLTVQVWDKGMVKAVEKAIRDSGLGLNPAADGMLIRVPIPQLTTERRNELVKMAQKYAEGARVAVRGVRRDGMEQVKAQEKKKTIGEDVAKTWSEEVQKLTDQHVAKVDEALKQKEQEIMQV